MIIRVGITGQAGFVGTHLYNTLGLTPDKFQRIPFEDSYFQEEEKLKEFVTQCDAIVHLAALNRHNDPDVIYKTNIELVRQLIVACEETNSKPHILFSSSTQEERDNPYSKSKREGRELFEAWSQRNRAPFTGMVIPNVFGPFGNPYYNSVVATFCHQLTHDEIPRIEVDGELKLIYVGELVDIIIKRIIDLGHRVTQSDTQSYTEPNTMKHCETLFIESTSAITVSKLLELISSYQENYFAKGIIPNLDNAFERNLFNTFLCYIDHASFFPYKLDLKSDERGSFVETIKLNSGGQVSFSTTKPGITRGNHFHTRKAERFAVIKGKAIIEIRRIGNDKVLKFEMDGSRPLFVDMPIWHTHNITNIGNEDLYTIFWINEHFDANDPDTYFEKV